MKYLLDTNVLIRLLQAKEPLNSRIRKFDPSIFAISGFTEAEIMFGVENSSDEFREKNRIARALGMQPFRRIYHDADVSEAYGHIKSYLIKNKIYLPSNEIDIFIAATARSKNMTLVTENIRDFEKIPGLEVEDWSVPA